MWIQLPVKKRNHNHAHIHNNSTVHSTHFNSFIVFDAFSLFVCLFSLLSSDGSAAPAPFYNSTTRECRYALSRTVLTLKHEITGSVSGASVNLYITSVFGKETQLITYFIQCKVCTLLTLIMIF